MRVENEWMIDEDVNLDGEIELEGGDFETEDCLFECKNVDELRVGPGPYFTLFNSYGNAVEERGLVKTFGTMGGQYTSIANGGNAVIEFTLATRLLSTMSTSAGPEAIHVAP